MNEFEAWSIVGAARRPPDTLPVRPAGFRAACGPPLRDSLRRVTTAAVFAFIVLAAAPCLSFGSALEPGTRVLLDAHNAYPYQGRWDDRIDRALATGLPVAIEQDLVWRSDEPGGSPRSIVSHGAPFTGREPGLEEYFFERIRPAMERALKEEKTATWPLIVLNLDFKTNEAEHHRALWDLLGKYEPWLTTARKSSDGSAVMPLRPGPLLVLTGDSNEQERFFHARVKVGENLRLFGAVHAHIGSDGAPRPASRTNYRRWWNNSWRVVEPEGQPAAGSWTVAKEARLRRLVETAHAAGLWIRFYTLNGHDPEDQSGGWSPGYNFGSLEAVQLRWEAVIRAGVDFVAVDQYEEFASFLRSREPDSQAASVSNTITLTGTITRADYERLFEREFDVAEGTKRIEVTLSYSGDERRTVFDLGLRGPAGFRGWSGGGPQTVVVGPTWASYGYLPGGIEPGRWAVVLGVPNIREGSSDEYTLTIRQFTREEPHFPILDEKAGWFTGDFHAHSGHSDGRIIRPDGTRVKIPTHRVFDAAKQAGLDFIALTDHNTSSHWTEVDRLQPFYEGMLLLHGREVTTYNGHLNTIGEQRFVDFRLTSSRSMGDMVRELSDAGSFLSINHPAAPDDERCMGCGWSNHSPDVMRLVDAVEIVNGDAAEGPLAGWPFWARMLNAGYRPVAIGGSDEHTAEETRDRAVGTPATVVYAEQLSEPALVEGLRRGRAYVRTRGPAGPALELTASDGASSWQMGDTVPTVDALTLEARVTGAAGQRLIWIRNGEEIASGVLTEGRPATLPIKASPGDWFSVLIRDAAGITLFSNAIFIGR